MKTLCAWCQSEAGQRPQPDESHGICAPHFRKLLAGAGVPEEVIADSLAKHPLSESGYHVNQPEPVQC